MTRQLAFAKFAGGDFDAGLKCLGNDEQWRDELDTLDGPFCLSFPSVAGWGEGVLLASLLKRYAAAHKSKVDVFAAPQVCSMLKKDSNLNARPVSANGECRERNGRSPLAILRRALVGDLLSCPFVAIGADSAGDNKKRDRYRIGIAWASMSSGGPIGDKSIPLDQFVTIIENSMDVDIVTFQRRLIERDRARLSNHFGRRCTFLSDDVLEADDQSAVMAAIGGIDCMLTISTTTAHVAASLGVPVVLVVAERLGPQWFWIAQRRYGRQFYPSVDIVLGMAPSTTSEWWKDCLLDVRQSLMSALKS